MGAGWIPSDYAPGQEIVLVLNIEVLDVELVKRVTIWRMCKCRTTYHVQFNKRKVEGKCDACGADFYRRETTSRSLSRKTAGLSRPDPAFDLSLQQGGLVPPFLVWAISRPSLAKPSSSG